MRLKWGEVDVWGSGHPDWCHFLTHLRLCVCVCRISPWPVWPGGGVYDKPLSLLSVSSQPDIYPKHSHNVMGTNALYTSSASSEWYRLIKSLKGNNYFQLLLLLVPLWPPCSSRLHTKLLLMCLFPLSGTWPSCRQWEASRMRRHARGYEASSKDRCILLSFCTLLTIKCVKQCLLAAGNVAMFEVMGTENYCEN